MTYRIPAAASAALGLSLAGACSDDKTASDASDTAADSATAADTDAADAAPDALDASDDSDTAPDPTADCDPLDPSHCALPFPSNLYLKADATTVTGFRLDFGSALPRNQAGTPVDPAPYRRLDGYGVGTPLLVNMPKVDLTGMATEWHTDASLSANAKIVWLELAPGDSQPQVVPWFVDVDASDTDPVTRVLIVRPARLLRENAREIVAFRNMVDTDGQPIARSAAFQALLDGTSAGDARLAPRQALFDDIFGILTAHGVVKSELTLAWDFHTASDKALHQTMLQMRDEGLAAAGPNGPELKDVVVTETPDDENWALEIRGKFVVPSYMFPTPGFNMQGNVWKLEFDADGKAKRNGTAEADFWLEIPKSAVDGSHTPHGLVLYGHGQNGLGEQVHGGMNAVIANTYHYIYFACDMWGMSENDVVGIVDTLYDLSGFTRVSDRLHQGMLNHVLLMRAMKMQLATRPEITSRGIAVDATKTFYSGISQGGIYGPTVVALSPDIQRAHFGVPGNNYSFLLGRSRNFAPFFLGLSSAYPARADQLIVLQAIENLWEMGGDSSSYIRHLHADPFPLPDGTPGTPKEALWCPAKGDVQVAPTSNEWLARSDIGISIMKPWNAATRPTVEGAAMADYPRTGSGIVLWDFGNPWPDESVNLPPTSDFEDPHDKPRHDPQHSKQLDHFFQTGEIIDVCSDDGTAGCAPE
ncbi:MAG: hypothetical protein U1F43_14660 [Myxococcota bacterium]